MTERLPAHLEIGALIRLAQMHGGFASVLHKGERDAGTILLVLTERGTDPRLFERLPDPDGTRNWHLRAIQDIDNKDILDTYLSRRTNQDPDLWIVELDIVNGERFIGLDRAID